MAESNLPPQESPPSLPKASARPAALLSPETLRRLQGLRLLARRVFAGQMKGERRSKQRGSSVEFADFRDYAPGDDPRFVDWNIFGRHGRLSIKLFLEEEDLPVHFLVDTSASMGFGEPRTKLRMAQELAGALAHVAASGLDRVTLGALGATNRPPLPARRGRQAVGQLHDWLLRLEASGATNLETAVRHHLLRMGRPGLVVVLGDFLDPAGPKRALSLLAERGCEVHVLQILSPEELDPSATGDLRLVDSETVAPVEVTITPRLLRKYTAALSALTDGLKAECRRKGMGYQLISTAEQVDQVIHRTLRRAGLVG